MIKIECEGVDGSGKTTGLKYLVEEAKKRNLSAIETREVGNPHVDSCIKMRELVLDPKNNMSGETMELIFSAMRIESDIWLKNLKKSKDSPDLIISDRGYFSHLAYGLHNTSQAFVMALFENFMAKQTALPDIVIYFDVNTETALKRRIKRGEGMDAIEMKGVEFQEKVRKSFEKYLSECNGIEKFFVNANESLEGVKKQLDVILDQIQESIGKA
jgi:dTMP kinase